MNPNLTDITVLLDRSASMYDLREETIKGYNTFLREQQRAPGECRLSLNQFNHKMTRMRLCEPIANARPLDGGSYVTGGNTALYDALGLTIEETGERLAALPAHERPGRVLIVTTTDGDENASRRFNLSGVREKIEHQGHYYNWQFLFLASDLRAIETAYLVGITAANVLHKSSTPKGETDSYAYLASNVLRARSLAPDLVAACVAFTPEQRAEADAERQKP